MTQLSAAHGNDPFMMDLIIAVFGELEREAEADEQQQNAAQSLGDSEAATKP